MPPRDKTTGTGIKIDLSFYFNLLSGSCRQSLGRMWKQRPGTVILHSTIIFLENEGYNRAWT